MDKLSHVVTATLVTVRAAAATATLLPHGLATLARASIVADAYALIPAPTQPSGDWILAAGVWDDAGVWSDASAWID